MSSLNTQLNGRVALVTGGTSGIGLAIAESLLAHGAKVMVGSRSAGKLEEARTILGDAGHGESVAVQTLDVADHASIDAAFAACADTLGEPDILVNCAGVNQKKPTLDITDEEHRFVMEVNYFGPFYASQVFARRCAARGMPSEAAMDAGGYSIVNVCSVTSFFGLSEVTPYATSKSAMLGLTRQLAVEWPRLYGIRVNAIAPGFVPADQNRAILKSGDRGKRILENTPMQRFGTPDEIAGAVTFLSAPMGRFMNGACINVDGGFMINGVSDAQAE